MFIFMYHVWVLNIRVCTLLRMRSSESQIYVLEMDDAFMSIGGIIQEIRKDAPQKGTTANKKVELFETS